MNGCGDAGDVEPHAQGKSPRASFTHPSQLVLPEDMDMADLAPAGGRCAARRSEPGKRAATPERPQRRSRRAAKRERTTDSDSAGYSGGRSTDVRTLLSLPFFS